MISLRLRSYRKGLAVSATETENDSAYADTTRTNRELSVHLNEVHKRVSQRELKKINIYSEWMCCCTAADLQLHVTSDGAGLSCYVPLHAFMAFAQGWSELRVLTSDKVNM